MTYADHASASVKVAYRHPARPGTVARSFPTSPQGRSPYAGPYQGGPMHMTRADNGTLPLGRSRDTDAHAFVGAACLPPSPPTLTIPLLPVQLHVWGETRADVLDAERTARDNVLAGLWDIIEVIPVQGGLCPIPTVDAAAVAQGADYGQAWATYRAGRG